MVSDVPLCPYFASLHFVSDLIRMERIKVRQQKFKRGKERMLSMAQESGEGKTFVQPEEDDDDGMMKAARTLRKVDVKVIWLLKSVLMPNPPNT